MSLSGGVLLGPGTTGRAQGLQILVPRGYEDQTPAFRCLVPGCGAVFFEGERAAWEHHVGPCARANRDRLPRSQAAMEDFDPEVSAHLRRVGERMLAEGRMEVKPNEAAGFS